MVRSGAVAIMLLAISCRGPTAEKRSAARDAGVAPTPAAAKPIDALPADPGNPRRRYQLAIEPCREQFQCRTLLRLADGDRVLDTAELGDSGSQEASAEKVDAAWGGGDPLEGAPQARAWATGDPDKSVYASTLMRTVRLAGGRLGVLVTRRAGWDHVRHAHKLFVSNGSKLAEVWSAEDTSSPQWSSTQVVPRPDGTDELLLVTAQSNEGGPDTLDVARVTWDEKAGKVVETPAQEPAVHHVVFGAFPRLAAARAAQAKLAECRALWVLPGKAVPGAGGAFVLTTVTTNPGAAAQATKDVQRCAPRTVARVITSHPRP